MAESYSVLYSNPSGSAEARALAEPACLRDLHLDRVLARMTEGREEYGLAPVFFAPLSDPSEVQYRQDVSRDLERAEVHQAVEAFAAGMRRMRAHLRQVEKLHYVRQKQRWFVDAVDVYCAAVRSLAEDLKPLQVSSHGLRRFHQYLVDHTASETFAALARETDEVKRGLSDVRYTVHIKGRRVTVDRYDGEPDLSEQIEGTFARFKQAAADDYLVRLADSPEMNHVEARILDLVTQLYPTAFAKLNQFCAGHRSFVDRVIAAFDREVQFYLGYLELVARLRSAGLSFCYPEISSSSREIFVEDAFDLALADKLAMDGAPVVTNDVRLEGDERILVITGPNQGGKTTFARMVGQLHYLASLGLPVPGTSARLFLPDRVFTHFEREEDLATLRGKLEDELVRIREILDQTTRNSVVIMNESFASTTASDALLLGSEIITRLTKLGALCVYVTFVDELATLNEHTVSMVATVLPEDPTVRTFKVLRRPADGLAYAAAIADKYGLGYESLRRRLTR